MVLQTKTSKIPAVTLAIIIFFACILSGAVPTADAQTHFRPVSVPEGTTVRVGVINNFKASKLTPSLALDRESFVVHQLTVTEFQSQLAAGTLAVDVLVLANLTYSPALVADVRKFLDVNGGALFIILGENHDSQVLFLNTLGLLAAPEVRTMRQQAIWNFTDPADSIVKDVNWKAIPEARTYTNASWRLNAINILLQTPAGAPLLLEAKSHPGRLLIMTPWMSTTDNRDYELSLQYNYINYHILKNLAGQTSLSYTDWPYSPVPHTSDRPAIFVWLGMVCLLGIGGFMYARHRAKRPLTAQSLKNLLRLSAGHKEGIQENEIIEATELFTKPLMESHSKAERGAQKRTEPRLAKGQETEQVTEEKENTSSEWEQVGMHRQIASFFFHLILMLIIAVPGLFLSLYIYPNFIQPYPQVVGWQNVAGGFFGPLWTILDLGIGTAAVKYFAEYRVKDPQKAVRFLQLLCWWSILAAVIKTVIIASLGMFFFTQGNIAHLGWIVLLIALQQFPGCAGILGSTLDGTQRYDYKIICDVIGGMFLNTCILFGTILLVRAVFQSNPAWAVMYGDSFGTVVALYVGGIVTTWMSFLYYAIAFKKLGFSVTTLFRADFSKGELKQAVAYGWKLTAGSLIIPVVGFLETTLVVSYVLNLNASMGYYAMMATVVTFVGSGATMFADMRAGISEAHGNGKTNLLRYYITEGLHYINIITYVLFAVLLAIGAPLLVGFTGPNWAPAGQYVVILCVWQLVSIYSTVGDTILQGTDCTKYNAYVWILEQLTRALLLILIIPGLRLYEGILYAAIPAVIVKEVAEYAIIRRRIVKFDWAVMHNFIVPGLAALVLYFFNRLLLALIWQPTLPASITLFLVAVPSSLFLYLFLIGFFGGWDENTLEQFKRGLQVIKLVRKFFFTFYKVTEFGHRCSPWKNHFPVKGYDIAMAEAKILTEEKRKLVI
ncbi:MAG: hypothetical protein CVU71_01725 [Deltaproteobacteria bacterium HGW-Deltaproteobacteria-6]|nr:MAG: hypothetical protein CVU71_01725 [Deltaproteobacteria bacterium HGW-Deltaproteobacteria-6]